VIITEIEIMPNLSQWFIFDVIKQTLVQRYQNHSLEMINTNIAEIAGNKHFLTNMT
jgi:hypothetical protein